jgi:mannose-6-phosphate isomerase-like protein (cupin superfamily)
MVTPPVMFPGATAVSGLSVYPWEAEDGRCGGSPHMHLTCTEAYVTISGEGSLQTLTAAGLREVPLTAGTVAWFSPGTIHRAVNGGDLRVMVIMQNGGLPEAGDAVLTYPSRVLDDPGLYRRPRSPRERRDLAVQGFLELVETGDLERFYRRAVALVSDRLDEWTARWQSGPVQAARLTGEHLTALREGRIDHLLQAGVRTIAAPDPENRAYGMCGMLDVYRP